MAVGRGYGRWGVGAVVLLVVLTKRSRIASGKEKSFLYATAIHKLAVHQRKRSRRRRLNKEFAAAYQSSCSTAKTVDKPAASEELERIVREAIDELPPRTQKAILRVYFSGDSVADTADAMGIAPITVYKLLAKGISRLKSLLQVESD